MQQYPPGSTQPTPIVRPKHQYQPLQPPPHKPRSRNRFVLLIAAISLVLIVALGLVWQGITSATPAQVNHPTPTVDVAGSATSAANDELTATAIANFNATITAAQSAITDVPYTPTPRSDIGNTQSSGPWSISVNSIKTVVSDNEFEVPKAGNEFIDINFTALNTDSAAHDMNPFYFTLRDDSGTSYTFSGLTTAANPDGTVVGGQKLRGDLTYEIPKSVHILVLQFDSPDDLDNSQIVQWNLTV